MGYGNASDTEGTLPEELAREPSLAVASAMRWTSPGSGAAAPHNGQDVFHQGDCAMSAAFIGLDLAKSVFQVHGVDAQGKVVVTKRLRRDAVLAFFANLPVCVVGMEACAGSHFWARELTRLGHTVRLMAPQYVKPYVKRQKNDRADAEAICEAVQRPSMRFVAVKSEDQQSTLAIHRVRETLVAQKTQLINALRAHLAEFGIIAPQGAGKVAQLTAVVADLEDARLPT